MANNQKEEEKLKYPLVVEFLTSTIVLIGMIIISYASFLQTVQGFAPMADSTMIILGFPLGATLPYIYGIVFQYGQNVALFIRKNFTKGKILWEYDTVIFGTLKITDSSIVFFIFILCCFVDAGTNILWLANTIKPSDSPIINVVLPLIGYPTMIAVVFVEELMGFVAQAMSKSYNMLKDIREKEKKQQPQQNTQKDNRQESNNTDQRDYRTNQQEYNQSQQRNDREIRPDVAKKKGDSTERNNLNNPLSGHSNGIAVQERSK